MSQYSKPYAVDWTTPDKIGGKEPSQAMGGLRKLELDIDDIYTVLNDLGILYYGTSAPANPEAGRPWLDSTNMPSYAELKFWDGSAWVTTIQVRYADKVDGYDANATPTASTLLPLDTSAKFPNSVLYTGTGNGLDADKVDGYDAQISPAPYTIPVADAKHYISPEYIPPAGYSNGVFGGGYDGSNNVNVIDYIAITTLANATDFGDLTVARNTLAATSNGTSDRGVFGGGGSPDNTIDYITISTPGDATDFDDLTVARDYLSATSNATNDRGVFGGGYSSAADNTIDYITISTPGNATDFGDLTVARYDLAATSNA